MKIANFGVRLLFKAVPTISAINLWAANNGQPRPLINEPLEDMSRYSTLIPGRLWLHNRYRLIGWGYKWPRSLQFKAEYLNGNGEVPNEMKTFRVPLF